MWVPPTGFPPSVAAALRERAGGLCEYCRSAPDVHSHHRRPRGMGGDRSPVTNSAANGLRLCLGCHEWAESHRAEAFDLGLLVARGNDPSLVPVWLTTPYGRDWWLLSPDGVYLQSDPP
jgi:hypothetical protein